MAATVPEIMDTNSYTASFIHVYINEFNTVQYSNKCVASYAPDGRKIN
jgi:hypothetical protein